MGKIREKFIETLREEDDMEDEEAYTLEDALDDFVGLLFNREEESIEVNEEEPRKIDGKRIVKVYNDDFDPNYKHDLNCVFEKAEDPAKGIESGIPDESKIINLEEYRNRTK